VESRRLSTVDNSFINSFAEFPDLRSSNSSSSNSSEAKEGGPDLSSNSSSNRSSSSCSSSCSSDCDLHNHNFDPVDDAADLLQQEECDYDSDNEASVELRGLVRDAEDVSQDVYPDAREEDLGEPLEENVMRLEIEIDTYERWRSRHCQSTWYKGQHTYTRTYQQQKYHENKLNL
jgi:hypothetical protein